MNYTYQSFNFRGRDQVKPYYDLIANIATEEFGHIELVVGDHQPPAHRRPATAADVTGTPLRARQDGTGNRHHFIATGLGRSAATRSGNAWTGDYVFTRGNLILDLLHNFFLENGARTNKLRVYEMTKDPCAREMLGYLFVRGGVHALAYAKALEQLTGVQMSKMLPIPTIPDADFKEAREFTDKGCTASLTLLGDGLRGACAPSGRATTRSPRGHARGGPGTRGTPAVVADGATRGGGGA